MAVLVDFICNLANLVSIEEFDMTAVAARDGNLHVFSGELNCPHDCPRLNTKEYGCDKGRCPRVKAIIKQLKA